MEKRITFRSVESTKAIENYINEHFKRVEEFLLSERQPIFVDIVLEPSKVHAHHRVEMRVKNPDYEIICDFEGPEFYKVVDKCIDTLLLLLHEKKRELVQKRHEGKRKI